jgi:hypothetical protein
MLNSIYLGQSGKYSRRKRNKLEELVSPLLLKNQINKMRRKGGEGRGGRKKGRKERRKRNCQYGRLQLIHSSYRLLLLFVSCRSMVHSYVWGLIFLK